MPISIAIDGPAGAGKSTIAGIIAAKRNLTYLDTGAMYRACAVKALQSGISCSDAESVESMINSTKVSIIYRDGVQRVLVDNIDVTDRLRTPEVSKGSSDISAIPAVRIRMVEIQREIARSCDVILDGRDIGTYVLPNATVKIFLTASVEERALRRYNELLQKGQGSIDLESVRKDIEYRDYQDSNRKFAPLKKAEDAIEVDTTGLSIEQTAERIIAIIDSK